MSRRIPASGINLFQLIYILIREYSEKTGLEPLNMSLGNPDGVPTDDVLELQARFAKNPAFELHTYAEDNNLNRFAEGMVALHGGIEVDDFEHLKTVPVPGIKGASSLVTLACGLHLSRDDASPDRKRRDEFHVVSNLPAYDVLGTWNENYLGTNRIVWPLASSDNMRLNLDRLKTSLQDSGVKNPDVIFVIRPGNPAAVGANEAEWKSLIEFCIERNTRLVNDAAYAGLTTGDSHIPLAKVACDYKELEWAEVYSCSKSFNDPGARLGAMVGSKDFIEDYIMIKGNTDSGPVPSVMAAYGEFFQNRELAQKTLDALAAMYQERLGYVIPRLKAAGLEPACETEAGFFTLWRVPKKALGCDLEAESQKTGAPLHEAFNRKLISETGLVGVHFQGPLIDGKKDSLIRYAVCTDVLNPKFQERFEAVMEQLQPEY